MPFLTPVTPTARENVAPIASPSDQLAIWGVPTPYISGSLKVYLNGVRQKIGNDYTETTRTTFTTIPALFSGDTLLVDYLEQ